MAQVQSRNNGASKPEQQQYRQTYQSTQHYQPQELKRYDTARNNNNINNNYYQSQSEFLSAQSQVKLGELH